LGIFAHRAKTSSAPSPVPAGALSERVRLQLPPMFDAVGEALAGDWDAAAACEAVGRVLGQQGVSLEETLEGLRTTYGLVRDLEPSYGDARAVALGWSESTLGYLHQLSCADPLTGLASMAHLRGRLAELYRGGTREPARLRESHALVVVETVPWGRTSSVAEVFGGDLMMSRIGESVGSVFCGSETICRIGPRRVVVLADRDEHLGRRLGLLRRLLTGGERQYGHVRIWVEGLPEADDTAALLLDELSRDQTA
jgi:hypothetical protein